MKSFATADFWEAYAELVPEVREQAQRAYQLWQENPLHPSLHFKKVGTKRGFPSYIKYKQAVSFS